MSPALAGRSSNSEPPGKSVLQGFTGPESCSLGLWWETAGLSVLEGGEASGFVGRNTSLTVPTTGSQSWLLLPSSLSRGGGEMTRSTTCPMPARRVLVSHEALKAEKPSPVCLVGMLRFREHQSQFARGVAAVGTPFCFSPAAFPFHWCWAVLSCSVTSNSLRPHGLQPARLLRPWDSPGRNTGVGCHALLQGIFPTQGSNPGLLHWRWILYCLSHQGNPSLQLGASKVCPHPDTPVSLNQAPPGMAPGAQRL